MPQEALDQPARDLGREALRRIDIHQAECEQLRDKITVKLDYITEGLDDTKKQFGIVHTRVDAINKKLWAATMSLIALLGAMVWTLIRKELGL